MLEVLAHPDLPHHLVLVPVDPCQHANVRDCILNAIRQLICIKIVQSVLDMCIHDHLGDAHDLSEEVEGVAEPGVLPFPGGESLARLQVEVEVQVEVLEAASVHEDVEHVVRLLACLQRRLHPVQLSGLEELGSVESAEKTTLSQGFGGAVVQSVVQVGSVPYTSCCK